MRIEGLPSDTSYYLDPTRDVDPRIKALCRFAESSEAYISQIEASNAELKRGFSEACKCVCRCEGE